MSSYKTPKQSNKKTNDDCKEQLKQKQIQRTAPKQSKLQKVIVTFCHYKKIQTHSISDKHLNIILNLIGKYDNFNDIMNELL